MGRPKKINRLDYSQFLFNTQTNYTLTYFSDHIEEVSHDAINRYLKNEKLAPKLIWEHAKKDVIQVESGSIVFDNTVLDKTTGKKIETSKRQYSGQSKKVVNGIGIVNCVYVHPNGEFWVIDYRIYDPSCDGKTKIDHVRDMLHSAVYSKDLLFQYVLMDTWYATHNLMLLIDNLGKIFYCPIRTNRSVTRADILNKHQSITSIEWSEKELKSGIFLHLKGFPSGYYVMCFRIAVSSNRTDFVVTNDQTQNDSELVKDVYKLRWPIETFHREIKQLTGVQKCQCRNQRIQRNHIACSYLVWVCFQSSAKKTNTTVYKIKENLLSDYLKQKLSSPAYSMSFA